MEPVKELSALAAYNKRICNHNIPNNFKRHKCDHFINDVVTFVKANKLNSIDEAVHLFKSEYKCNDSHYKTLSTSTIYNYVHGGIIELKPLDLPRMVQRRIKKNKYKLTLTKGQKGTSIEKRPFKPEDRSEFGHWEGDLVTGPRDGQSGAYLTLIERQTRFYYMIPIPKKSSKQVLMKINKLNKFYGADFSKIFKSITFDNGNEFARHKDIEKKPGTSIKRTFVYFGRPYHSCDRASNENCNGLIRRFIKKGTDINTVPLETSIMINNSINHKHRKILNYSTAEELFLEQLSALSITNNTIYYNSFSLIPLSA